MKMTAEAKAYRGQLISKMVAEMGTAKVEEIMSNPSKLGKINAFCQNVVSLNTKAIYHAMRATA